MKSKANKKGNTCTAEDLNMRVWDERYYKIDDS